MEPLVARKRQPPFTRCVFLSYNHRENVPAGVRVYDVSSVNPTLTSLVEQLVSAVHQETLHESRPEMQRVLDAEKAFEP